MIAMSVIRGTLVSTVRPGASSAAAISLSAEFFAPTTVTSPASRAPPSTRIRSTPAVIVTAAIVAGRSAIARRDAAYAVRMAVHLTRIYTRTGDAGTTALGDGSRVAKTDPRIEAYADVDEANAAHRGGARARRACRRSAHSADDRTERPVRCGRGSVHADRRRPEVAAAAGRPRSTSPGSRAGATSSTRGCRSWTRSSCPAVRRARRCCTSPAPSPGGPSAGLGAVRGRPGADQPARRRSTSTGCPTCCSSWPGWPTRTAT